MLRRPAAMDLGFVCLLAFFAGCTDNPLPEASEAEAGALPGVPTSTGLSALPVAYAGPEHLMKELWFNGSYASPDAAYPIGGPVNMVLQDRRAERTYDISSELPPGVPTMLMVEVDASVSQGAWPQGGDIDVGMRSTSANFISIEGPAEQEGGHHEYVAIVQALSDEPIWIVVFYDQMDPSAAITYTLHVSIMTRADVILPGAVAGLKLSPGDLLVLEPAGEPAEFTLFDPSDHYVDRYDVVSRTEIRVPSDRPDGEYVLVAKQGAGGIRVSAIRNHTDPVRALGGEWAGGADKPVSGTATWSEKVTRPILMAGFWIHGTDQPYRCTAIEGTMTGPGDDELIQLAFDDPTCAGAGPFGFEMWGQTQRGLSAVRQGTYALEVKAPDTLNLYAQAWFLHYNR